MRCVRAEWTGVGSVARADSAGGCASANKRVAPPRRAPEGRGGAAPQEPADLRVELLKGPEESSRTRLTNGLTEGSDCQIQEMSQSLQKGGKKPTVKSAQMPVRVFVLS